ncbi:hypothetical protein PLANPX_0685 [Lacipirellula parvula]|uniref:Uncharacterized protein n=1 Tax=Lacipirellula parvula TaxID=2650471 RepID=A0A5K7X9G8_9BACT|nr:hypothetical protein PLANPX_0685 [Lacipirellula parvula]
MTPTGVEHIYLKAAVEGAELVRDPLTPTGVEHNGNYPQYMGI